MRYYSHAIKRTIIAIALLGIMPISLEAATSFVWNGSQDAFFSNCLNWTPNCSEANPLTGGDLEFGSSSNYGPTYVHSISVADIQFFSGLEQTDIMLTLTN